MMNQLYRCVFLCLLLIGTLSASTSMAQTPSPPPQEQQEENTAPAAGEESAEQEQAQEEEKIPAAQRNNADTFVPSEEISEDLSVSFPVDI